jgi:DedD protein
VSVGRGVRSGPEALATDQEVGAAGDTTVATAPPVPTQAAPGELSYHEMLQGGAPQTSSDAPAAAPVEQPAVATPEPTPVAEAPPADTPASSAGAASPPAPAPPAPAPPAQPEPAAESSSGSTGGWVVQVGAFGSRENANSLVAHLKSRGYAAFLASAGNSHRVRVGPFPNRAEADRVAGRLEREEGMKPLVTR